MRAQEDLYWLAFRRHGGCTSGVLRRSEESWEYRWKKMILRSLLEMVLELCLVWTVEITGSKGM